MVKVERSFPAPDSLAEEKKKANGSYSEPDVIERLAKISIINAISVNLISYRIHRSNI